MNEKKDLYSRHEWRNIPQVGRIGKIKIQDKAQALIRYARLTGERRDDTWYAKCQSCGLLIPIGQADPAHKIAAGVGGDQGGRVQAGNIMYVCRPCHDYIDNNDKAGEFVATSTASCATGERIKWTRDLALGLTGHLRRWHGIR